MSDVRSELTAAVFTIQVGVGDVVAAGDTVAVLESMKMEIPVVAETAGTVAKVLVAEGEMVEEGAVIVRLET